MFNDYNNVTVNGFTCLTEDAFKVSFWKDATPWFRFEDFEPGFKGEVEYAQVYFGEGENGRLLYNFSNALFAVDGESHLVLFAQEGFPMRSTYVGDTLIDYTTDVERQLTFVYRSIGRITSAKSFPGGEIGAMDPGLEVFTDLGETVWLPTREYGGRKSRLYKACW